MSDKPSAPATVTSAAPRPASPAKKTPSRTASPNQRVNTPSRSTNNNNNNVKPSPPPRINTTFQNGNTATPKRSASMAGVRDTVEKVPPNLRQTLVQQVRYEGPTASIGRRLLSAESPHKANSFVLSKMIVTPSANKHDDNNNEGGASNNRSPFVEEPIYGLVKRKKSDLSSNATPQRIHDMARFYESGRGVDRTPTLQGDHIHTIKSNNVIAAKPMVHPTPIQPPPQAASHIQVGMVGANSAVDEVYKPTRRPSPSARDKLVAKDSVFGELDQTNSRPSTPRGGQRHVSPSVRTTFSFAHDPHPTQSSITAAGSDLDAAHPRGGKKTRSSSVPPEIQLCFRETNPIVPERSSIRIVPPESPRQSLNVLSWGGTSAAGQQRSGSPALSNGGARRTFDQVQKFEATPSQQLSTGGLPMPKWNSVFGARKHFDRPLAERPF
eukprot:PhF_6_TR4487/c1_g1_i1/m.6182